MKTSIFNYSHAFLVTGDIDHTEIIADLNIAPGDCETREGETLKIAEIREILRWLHLKPLSDGIKLLVIRNVDKINLETASVLLKTLEEPPSYAKIILTTLDEQKILPTIQSRCQKIRLITNPREKNIEEYLAPDELAKLTIKDRFTWVAKITELPANTITDILTAWQMYFREMMLSGADKINILAQISRAKDLTATNISVKLLLENLVLNF